MIADVVGPERTIGAFVNFGADYLGPGRIHYGGRGSVVLGELDGSATSRLATLHDLFLAFDDAAITTENIFGYLWGKLAYGAMLFATATTNESIADALATPAWRPVFTELGRETLRVADAKGIEPEGFNGFDPLAFVPGASDAQAEASLDAMVAFNRRSAKTHSGIWRDLAVRHRKTEVDAQLGPIVEHGAAVGVATPLVGRLIDTIHALENGDLALDRKRLDELAQAVDRGERA